jgi:hypothetical protein
VPPSRPAPRAPLRDGALPALQRGVRDRVGRDARAVSRRGTEAGPPRQSAPQGRRAPERAGASRRRARRRGATPQQRAPGAARAQETGESVIGGAFPPRGPHPFDPLSLRVLTPCPPLRIRGEGGPVTGPGSRGPNLPLRSPPPRQWRGGQGVRTTRGGQGVRTTFGVSARSANASCRRVAAPRTGRQGDRPARGAARGAAPGGCAATSRRPPPLR